MNTAMERESGKSERVAVFIDYMNAYEGAMQAVDADRSNPGTAGQFNPLLVAQMLRNRRQKSTGCHQSLAMIGVYRGMPSPTREPTKAAQSSRQVNHWEIEATQTNAPLIVRTRPLNYMYGKAREKGVDVMLAVDLVIGAHSDKFDAAVVFSGDTDLLPAIESATSIGAICDSASWVGGGRRLQPPSVSYEYRLDLDDYHRVRDTTNYSYKLRTRWAT